MSAAFDTIYRDNLWNGTASRSGPGSGWEATTHPARCIEALVDILAVESVLDLGCGDSLWMPELPGYIGMDVSTVAVQRARANHPDRRYELLGEPLPRADLVIVRDVIQHLSHRDARGLLARVRASGSTWLLASTYIDGQNVEIETGLDGRGRYTFSRPDLSVTPYGLGPPLLLIQDGWDYDTGTRVRDVGKHLGLWAVAW